MVKIDDVQPIIRSRSSSSPSESDDDDDDENIRQSSSSDSDLSLIETSMMNSSKSCLKRQISTSKHLIPQGTILRDVNNNHWIIHQCLQASRRSERFIYFCSRVKKSSMNGNDSSKFVEENLVKTKITPLTSLTEKLKQSREIVINKARAENEKLDYIFYGAMIGDNNKEIEFILPKSSTSFDFSGNEIIHGVVEFLQDDSSTKVNKYSIEILFVQGKNKTNSDLFQQILKKEIDKLKEIRKKSTNFTGEFHKFLIRKKSGENLDEIFESSLDENEQFSSSPSIECSSVKYLLKLEFVSSTPSKRFSIDDEISFYSRFATHEKLKSYVKRHGLLYIAIPEYIAHGTHKHLNCNWKFLIHEQYRENLRSLIYSYDQSLPEHNALNLFLQMLFVLQYLHEKNLVHQVIKPKYLMFANKQPYFIYLTQFRTVKSIQKTNNNKSNENLQVTKKVKRSHRTQLAAIQNKTPTILPVIDVPSPIIEEDQSLSNVQQYFHPFAIYSSLDLHCYDKQTYRGDLEMLGYNLIVWSGGQLPWEKKNHSNRRVKFERDSIPNEKKLAKSNVNEFVKKCFFMKLISPVTLRAICDYMSTVYQLNIDDIPNFDQLRAPIKEIVKALGFKANACLRLSNSKSKGPTNPSNVSTNQSLIKSNNQFEKQIDSPAKELEVERDDLDDEDEDEDETHPCSAGSTSCDEEEEEEEETSDDDDTQMEQQAPSMHTKCKRCGGDHSLEDQQSQSSSDKQSNSSTIPTGVNQSNTLTYQQKRQRSIAKRLQLRRKKKN